MPDPKVNPNIEKLHTNLTSKVEGFNVPLSVFAEDMYDPEKRARLHGNMPKYFDGFNVPFERFSTDMGISEKKSPNESTAVSAPVPSSQNYPQAGGPPSPRSDTNGARSEGGNGQGRASSTLGTFNQSFYGIPADILEAAAVGGTKIERLLGFESNTEDNPLYKAGQWYREALKEIAPNNPEYQGEIQEQVAHSLGQLGGLVLTGSASAGAKATIQGTKAAPAAVQLLKGATGPTAQLGAIQMGLPAFKEAKASGASDDVAFEVFLKNAAVGSVLERIPVQQFFARFNKVTNNGIVNLLKKGFAGGLEEGTTEVLQQMYGNFTAQQSYDKTRELIDGMKESGGIGFGLGFFLNSLGVSLRSKRQIVKDPGEREAIDKAIELVEKEQEQFNQQQKATPPDIESTINPPEEIAPEAQNITDSRENITQTPENIPDQTENVPEQVENVPEETTTRRRPIVVKFLEGKKADLQGATTPEEVIRKISETSESPIEIAQEWNNLPEENLSAKDQAIKDNLRNVSYDSFVRAMGKEQLEGKDKIIAANYFGREGKGVPVDVQVEQDWAKDLNVTIDDIFDFMRRYPGGARSAKAPGLRSDLESRFNQLTGRTLNDQLYQAMVDAQKMMDREIDVSPEIQRIIDSEGLTNENIDSFKDNVIFQGFPYDQEDFEIVKSFLNAKANRTTSAQTGGAGAGGTTIPPGAAESTAQEPAPIYNNEAIKSGDSKETLANIRPELAKEDTQIDVIKNDLAVKEAQRIVGQYPVDVVENTLTALNDMDPTLRRALGLELAKKYKQEGNQEKAYEIFDKYRDFGTKSAQATQFGNVARQDPFVQTMEVTKSIRDHNKEVMNSASPTDPGKSIKQHINSDFNAVKDIARQIGIEITDDQNIDQLINKIVNKVKSQEKVEASKDKIQKARARRKKLADEYKNRRNDLLLSSAIPGLSPKGIEHAIKVAKTYIDEGIANLQLVAENVRAHFMDNYGIFISNKDFDEIRKSIGMNPADYRRNLAIWDFEKELAAQELSDMMLGKGKFASKSKKSDKAPIEEFTRRLIDNIKKGEPTSKKAPKSDDAYIREVTDNIEKYREVLIETKNQLESEGIFTDDVADVFDLPFFQNRLRKMIGESLENLGGNLRDIIKQHYSVQQEAGYSISEEIINRLGLSDTDAQMIEDQVNKLFSEKMQKAADNQIRSMYGDKKEVSKPKRKDNLQKMIESINMGVFSEQDYINMVGESFGISAITTEDIEVLESLADKIQSDPSSEMQNRSAQDFHDHMRDIQKRSGAESEWLDNILELWYTNILSGLSTEARANKGALLTSFFEMTAAAVTNPKATFHNLNGIRAIARGLNNFGFQSWLQIIKDGYSDIDYLDIRPKGRGWISRLLAKKDTNVPEKVLKNVLRPVAGMYRVLIANDAWMKHGMQEYEAYIAEYNKALKDSTNIGSIFEEVNRRLALNNDFVDAAKAQVDTEIQERVANGEKLPGGFKKRRLQEVINQNRDAETVKTANRNANRNVLMNDPEGYLGMAYRALSKVMQPKKTDSNSQKIGKLAFRSVLPFMRVPTNFANMNISWTPLGFYNVIRGKTATRDGSRQMSLEERQRLFAKASMGSMLFSYLAAELFEWDEEKGYTLDPDGPLQITAEGPGRGWSAYKEAENVDPDYKQWSFRWRWPEGTPEFISGGKEWSDYYSYIDSPIGVLMAPLGIASDQIKYHDFQDKVDKGKKFEQQKRTVGQMSGAFAMGSAEFLTQQSYVQGLESLIDIISNIKEGRSDQLLKNGTKMVSRPVKGLLFPNLYKQLYQEYKSLSGMQEKEARYLYDHVLVDIPLAEQLVTGEKYDQFGYPIVREFGNYLIPDMLSKDIKANLDNRHDKPEWQLVHKYQEVSVGSGYRPPKELNGIKLSSKQMSEYVRDAGQEFSRLVQMNYRSLDKKDPMALQIALNKYKDKARETTRKKYLREFK